MSFNRIFEDGTLMIGGAGSFGERSLDLPEGWVRDFAHPI
jgi:hypothetical protein